MAENERTLSRFRVPKMTHLGLLSVLIGTLAIQSFLDGGTVLERTILNFSLFATVLSAIRSLSGTRGRVRFAIAMGFVALAASMLTEFDTSFPLIDAVYFCYLAVFVLLLIALSESVFSLGPTNLDRIIGAVSIYLVLALAWAFCYALLELHWPDSFNLEAGNRSGIHTTLVNDMFYFSTATLTTLGFGDIVPLTRPARMLTAMEAMVGQLYVAVVIAHIVGMKISQSVRRDAEPDLSKSNEDAK